MSRLSGRAPLADDPAAIRSATLFHAFGWYLRWYLWRHFHGVRISRTGAPPDIAGRPLIVYTNHPSWWDPTILILLSCTVLRTRRGFGPMDEAALAKYKLLRRFGIFGIDLGNARGAARFLSVSLRLLSDPGNLLYITAEGHFTDARTRPVRLRPGLAHLARRVPNAVIVPLAVEYTFWNERKPEALVRFGAPIDTGRQRSVAEWTAELEERLADNMDALATESMTRNPNLFRPLVQSSGGVGGVYDLWRRARSWAAGRRFDPSHEGQDTRG